LYRGIAWPNGLNLKFVEALTVAALAMGILAATFLQKLKLRPVGMRVHECRGNRSARDTWRSQYDISVCQADY
jgi:hypothetical protein